MKRILIPLLSLGLAGSLEAQTSSEIRREIADYQQQLNKLQTEQNTLRDTIATDKRSVKQLDAEENKQLTEHDNNIANDKAAITKLQNRAEQVNQEYAAYVWRVQSKGQQVNPAATAKVQDILGRIRKAVDDLSNDIARIKELKGEIAGEYSKMTAGVQEDQNKGESLLDRNLALVDSIKNDIVVDQRKLDLALKEEGSGPDPTPYKFSTPRYLPELPDFLKNSPANP